VIGMFDGISPLPRLATYAGAIGRTLINAVDSSNDQSLWIDASPSVLPGDFAVYDNLTQEGNQLTVTQDGIATIQTFGSSNRQSFFVAHWSRQLLGFGPNQKQYVNNVVPNGANQTLTMTVGVLFNQNMTGFFTNPEADVLVIKLLDGQPPTGTQITNGVITGTPIIVGSGQFTLGANDGVDDGTCIVSWIVNPSSTGTTAGSLVADIRAKSVVGGGLVS